jgi:hypothetical protein
MVETKMKHSKVGAERVCSVTMLGDKPCGRPVYPAPEHDEKQVCLMHSNDPEKSCQEFLAEFEQTLVNAEKGEDAADFAYFVFPCSDFRGKKFTPCCSFIDATFRERADFAHAIFKEGAEFYESEFKHGADFSHARFGRETVFLHSKFDGDTSFTLASFCQDAMFMSAKFNGKVAFSQGMFAGNALFGGARFAENANFHLARFAQRTDFKGARFSRLALFSGAEFAGPADFHEARFRHDLTDRPGLDFTYVKLAHPEMVQFYRTDLGQALFHHTDISKVDFALVEWRDRRRIERYRWRRSLLRARLALGLWTRPSFGRLKAGLMRIRSLRGSARMCLFEEDVNPFGAYSLDLYPRGPDPRNYSLIAESYQQLKRNYDGKGDYWTAGHWHYGEMEMNRLHNRWHNRWLCWLSQHFGLAALYRHASAYGESYVRPLVWLAAVMFVFAMAYPLLGWPMTTGLELNLPDPACAKGCALNYLNYWNYQAFFNAHPAENPTGWGGMLMHSAMTSLSVAGFQRELRYMPSYPWGRLAALVEMLLTTTLGGLFALAIRRRFKRS